jgi:transposase-like protein
VGRKCSICTHANRDAIDALLVSGASYQAIAKQWNVGAESVRRHHDAHLSPALQAMKAERELEEGASFLKRLESLMATTEAILSTAKGEGKVAAALAAVREMRGCLDLYARATGELKDQPLVSINLLTHPEAQSAIAIVLAELADHPEIRQRIAERLQLEAGPS